MAARVETSVVIDAPFDVVWKMTNDVESWPDMYTEYAKVEVLAREGAMVRFRVTTHPDVNGTVQTWVSERTPDLQARTARSRRIETGPFAEKVDLYWDYVQTPEGVRLRLVTELVLRPTAPVDEPTAVAYLTDTNRQELAHLRDVIEAAWADAQTI